MQIFKSNILITIPMVHIGWICFGIFELAFVHPMYISISQINHNQQNESIELTMKIFVDDLMEAIEREKGVKLYLGEAKEHPKSDSIINTYIREHLDIHVNESLVDMNFLGWELEQDALWCYLEGLEIPSISSMNIRNTILMDQFDTQTNIVHVDIVSAKRSVLLNKGKKEDSISFD